MKEKKHGGRRSGAGRKRRYSDLTIGGTFHLPPAFWKILQNYGSGSKSDALREALSDENAIKQIQEAIRIKPTPGKNSGVH